MSLEANDFSHGLLASWTGDRPHGRGTRRDGASGTWLLSQRDVDILNWILAGKSDREIGVILGLSAKTINYHVEKLKDRFAVVTRIQLVAACLHFGCLTWSPEHLMRQPAS